MCLFLLLHYFHGLGARRYFEEDFRAASHSVFRTGGLFSSTVCCVYSRYSAPKPRVERHLQLLQVKRLGRESHGFSFHQSTSRTFIIAPSGPALPFVSIRCIWWMQWMEMVQINGAAKSIPFHLFRTSASCAVLFHLFTPFRASLRDGIAVPVKRWSWMEPRYSGLDKLAGWAVESGLIFMGIDGKFCRNPRRPKKQRK